MQIKLQQQAKLPGGRRDWTGFGKSLEQLKQRADDLPKPWAVVILEADFLRLTAATEREGRQAALTQIKSIEQEFPNDVEFLEVLVEIYVQLGSFADAERVLDRFTILAGDSHRPYVRRCELFLARGEQAAAAKVLKTGTVELPADEARYLKEAFCELTAKRGDIEAYVNQLTELRKEFPTDVVYAFQLWEIAIERGDLNDAKRCEGDVRSLEGDRSTRYRYFRARRLLMETTSATDDRLNQAEKEFNELRAERPSWPLTYSLRGRIEERRENLDVATQSYQTAIELGDKRVSSYERLVLCLHRMGRVDEAEQRLSELVDLVPRSRTLSAVALSAAAKDQEGDRAVSLAKLGTEQRPGDALAWLWRGQLLAAKGQSKGAEECLRRAVEVAPNSVVAWNGLFKFYLKIGNRQAAREIINELPNRVKQENSRVVLFQARGYELLGDRKNAASMYETAVRLAPDNFEAQVRRGGFLAASDPVAAEKALRLALRVRPLSPRARRGLALVLA
ncbi:MAG: tetratricopeptide repeat protein, partial [Pirellulales bacterium]